MNVDPHEVLLRLESGAGLDPLLDRLRQNGYSKVGTMRVLVEARKFDLTEAKALVHESSVWGDVRAQDDQFLDKLIEAVEELDEPGSAQRQDQADGLD